MVLDLSKALGDLANDLYVVELKVSEKKMASARVAILDYFLNNKKMTGAYLTAAQPYKKIKKFLYLRNLRQWQKF